MQLTFAGTVIAQEPTEGGTDAVTGFMPKRHATVQWAEFLRSTDAAPLARLNRKRSLGGTIVYGPFSTLSSAAQKLLLNYDALPDSGPLVLLVGGINTFFANATLESVDAKQRMGVTVSATLTFQVGPGTNLGQAGAVLTDDLGVALTDQLGVDLTS